MASRKEQKEAARQRRLEAEQAAAAATQRTRRLQALGGVLAAAIVVVVVLVLVSSGGHKNKTVDPTSAGAKSTAATVNASLAGIHQSGNVLGNPKAKVTMTEFGDLECSVCKDFALTSESSLIAHEVKAGTVKLVYKSYETATSGAADGSTIFPVQQSAAYAAGAQDKAWNFILLFYHEQGTEGTEYVNTSYLTSLAKQVPGLDVSKWAEDRFNPTYTSQVTSDATQATQLGITGTPGIMFSGPKGRTKLVSGLVSYAGLQAMIKQVS